MQNVVKQAFTEKTASGENITIDNTIEAKMNVSLYGNTKQDGEPTPDTPVEIQRVTENNKVVVSNKNLWGEEEHGTINESTGVDVHNSDRWRTKGYIKVNSNTSYTLSSNASSDIWYIFYYYDKNKNFISSKALIGTTSVNWTTPSNCEYMRCVVGDTTTIQTTERQLELGNTATTYEPYQSQSYAVNLGTMELCKIGDYQDYFYKSGSRWYLVKNFNKYVEKSNDAWVTTGVASGSTVNTMRWQIKKVIADSFDVNDGVMNRNMCCNYFNRNLLGQMYGLDEVGYNLESKMFSIRLPVEIATTTTKVAQYFSQQEKPLTFYYQIAPTTIEITDTTLITQLNEISQALSQKGTTIISQRNDDLPFNLDVIALTK